MLEPELPRDVARTLVREMVLLTDELERQEMLEEQRRKGLKR
jgi:hypothetical protein